MRRHERRHPPQLCDQAKQADFVRLRISMVGWSQNRLEGRALEHGLVAVVRARLSGKPVCRPRIIRMLRANGTVDKIEDPGTLSKMQCYACRLDEGLAMSARFKVCFAEQTIHKDKISISIDLRGVHQRKESWVELKWTRGALKTALAAALEKALVLQGIGKEHDLWSLDKHLSKKKIPRPGFVGGLAVSPDGWMLLLVNSTTGERTECSGFFEADLPKPAPSKMPLKLTVAVRPLRKRCNNVEKYKRYNKSDLGKARSKRYKQDPAHKLSDCAYQSEYAKSEKGRAARTAARQRYKQKYPKAMKCRKRKRA